MPASQQSWNKSSTEQKLRAHWKKQAKLGFAPRIIWFWISNSGTRITVSYCLSLTNLTPRTLDWVPCYEPSYCDFNQLKHSNVLSFHRHLQSSSHRALSWVLDPPPRGRCWSCPQGAHWPICEQKNPCVVIKQLDRSKDCLPLQFHLDSYLNFLTSFEGLN